MNASPASAALDLVRDCLPAERPVALHEPRFKESAWEMVKDCLDSGWVSTVGSYVDKFETMLADYTGARRVIATVNGTTALHAALLLADVQPGDEVICPALTFVATANAISYCHATPHFVDSARDTLGLDPLALDGQLERVAEKRGGVCYNLQTGRPIRAVVAMHTFGHPVDLDTLAEVCSRWNLVLVEDAAESLGSLYKGRHTGRIGRIATLSFNGNKIITTGGGGALMTEDEELGHRAKHLTTTARVGSGWLFDHDMVGYNYRLPNLNAALGCAQMADLPRLVEAKRRIAGRYAEAFRNEAGVSFATETTNSKCNYWLNAILFEDPAERELFLRLSNDERIITRPPWRLMHELPIYSGCPRMALPVAEYLAARLANIPSSPHLGMD